MSGKGGQDAVLVLKAVAAAARASSFSVSLVPGLEVVGSEATRWAVWMARSCASKALRSALREVLKECEDGERICAAR